MLTHTRLGPKVGHRFLKSEAPCLQYDHPSSSSSAAGKRGRGGRGGRVGRGGQGGRVLLPRQAGDWHQFHRKPTRGRGVFPPQYEQEAGCRVADYQASGEMYQHERAEVLCDCDSYCFFCMNITTSSGFQERAAGPNHVAKL